MKQIIILQLLLITFPLFAQVEVVRDRETKQAYVKVEPLKPEISRYEPFVLTS